jgi:hypothetical protein
VTAKPFGIPELEALCSLAAEIATSTAWSMGLSGKEIPERDVAEMELALLADLLGQEDES